MGRELVFARADGWRIVCRELLTGWERLVGLLGTRADARPVALVGCSSVHTFGMRYAIDVALVRGDGYVVAARRSVAPARVFGAHDAHYAIERPASEGPWPVAGDWLLAMVREET